VICGLKHRWADRQLSATFTFIGQPQDRCPRLVINQFGRKTPKSVSLIKQVGAVNGTHTPDSKMAHIGCLLGQLLI
jgi:hypothetical protein